MINFASDYIAGAHPEVLQRLVETNLENLTGYSSDIYCASAREKIRQACQNNQADVYFLVGGTQTNQIVISTMLAPFEGVIAATTGHISVHEAGAIEFTGHKVLELPGENGKLNAKTVADFMETYLADGNQEHMVCPGMVYISFPTEYGTLYTKEELQVLYATCKQYGLPLFIDGARLGYGLCSSQNDVSLPDLNTLCDVFYIGGTKVGALCGEAVVYTHNNAPKHFMTQVKQHGAMLAKGRLLGVQFDALFTNDLYMRAGRHAIDMAERLISILEKKNYRFYLKSPTNQQFVIIDNDQMDKLSEKVIFGFWEKYSDTQTVIRFATSWSTTEADLDALEAIL